MGQQDGKRCQVKVLDGGVRWKSEVEGSGGGVSRCRMEGSGGGISLSLDPRVGLRFTVQGLGRIQVLGRIKGSHKPRLSLFFLACLIFFFHLVFFFCFFFRSTISVESLTFNT